MFFTVFYYFCCANFVLLHNGKTNSKMATVTAFVRGKGGKPVNIRFRLSDTRGVQLFYSGSEKIDPDNFDSKKQEVKARCLISQITRAKINKYILTTKQQLIEIYSRFKPANSQELTMLLDGGESTDQTIDIYYAIDRKIKISHLSDATIKHYHSLINILNEYAACTWVLDTTTTDDIRAFEAYVCKRGSLNYAAGLIKKIHAAWNNAIKEHLTTNNPFLNYKPITAIYGTPFYLTIEERNTIYATDLKNRPKLAVQRDIFIFQCCVGCRVDNLIRLTKNNIKGDYLEYIPTKTLHERADVIRVPLIPLAKEIINKYKGGEKLFPFIAAQKYNEDIKEILRLCGLNRLVTVLDPKSRKEKQVPIYTVASSHLARRTFCANLYAKVKDPNLIGSMSGHKPGSRAFERYRSITDDVKRDVIQYLE